MTTTTLPVGTAVYYNAERAIVRFVGPDAHGIPMAVIRLTGRRTLVVYVSELELPTE